MLVGTTFQPADYGNHLTRYPGTAVCRVFNGTDELPAWTDPRVQALVKIGVVPYLSCKGFDLGKYRTHLDTQPDNIPLVIYAQHHEPENDQATVSTVRWIARQHAIYDMITHHPKRARMLFATPLTKQWTENGGHSYSTYWCGAADAFAVDSYLNSWGSTTSYGDVTTWLASVLHFAASTGKPLWLPELGAVTRPGDPKDTGRAEWIDEVMSALIASKNCELVAWWCGQGQTGTAVPGLGEARNFHLHQRQTNTKTYDLNPAPSETVWKKYLTRGNSNARTTQATKPVDGSV